MRHVHAMLAVAIGALALAACESNPPLGPDPGSILDVELTVSTGHIHTLSPVTFTVAVRDGRGDPVTDFESISVERRLAVETGGHAAVPAEEPWRSIELTRQGDVYVGEYTFMTSGAYEFRVVGTRHGWTEERVLHEMHESMHAVRPHVKAGGYRIEFETFPGHLHAGNEATVKFWILEQEENAQGVRPPIASLAAEIHCLEPGGAIEQHGADEHEPGVYEAVHTFQATGDFKAQIHFTGADGAPASAEFTTRVVPGH